MMVEVTIGRVVLVLCALVTLGLGVAAAGLVPIAASTGHWKITDWFLHWTMQNSARTYSTFQTPEAVRDDSGLVSAAGHFRQACQVCHGAPGEAPSPVMQAGSPPAPDLAKTVGHYTDRELFWIVQHGVRFTGMPAWPSKERGDEVRRMVGFLRRLPGMTPAQYRTLTQPESTSSLPAAVIECTGCHGTDGMSKGQRDIPILAGQSAKYLASTLRHYRSKARSSAVMQTAAARLDDQAIDAAARYYAALPGLRGDIPHPPHPVIAKGNSQAQLPACSKCHRKGSSAPRIAGQRRLYLATRLRQWRGDATIVDANKPQDPMAVIARRIPEDSLDGLIAALSPLQQDERKRSEKPEALQTAN